MSIRIEIEPRVPSREKLSRAEIDKEAFAFITKFRWSLCNSGQFRGGLADSYLDLPDYVNRSKPSRRVEFNIDNKIFEVEYSFSEKQQSLLVIKKTLDRDSKGGALLKTDVITLRSRKFENQEPIRSPMIKYHYPVGSRIVDEPNIQVNNAFAWYKAREILAELTPQAPQK